MTSRAAAIFVLLLSLSAAVSLTAALPDENTAWIRVDTANFTLFSSVSRRHTLEVGRRLELFRHLLSGLLPELKVNSPLPSYVFIFRSDATFTPYKTQFGRGPTPQDAYFSADQSANFVALNAFPDGDPFATVYHEFVHYFLNNNFANLPLWFNEGLAEYYSTLLLSDIKDDQVEIGRPVSQYVGWLKEHSLIGLRELFEISTGSSQYNEEEKKGVFYAQSWALVHYLVGGAPDWGSSLTSRLARLAAGDDLISLVSSDTYQHLEASLGAYVMRGRFESSLVTFQPAEIDATVKVSRMERAEVLYRLGNLLSRIDAGKEEAARRHFRESIRVDPTHAAAHAGLGFLLELRRRHDAATSYYEKAFELDPDDPLTCFLLATNLSQRTHGFDSRAVPLQKATDPRLVRARELYRRSIRLRPGIAESYAGLGASYVTEPGDLSDGIAALETARRMLPSRMDVVFHLLQLRARNGDSQRAAALQQVLDREADAEMAGFGREALLLAELASADTLFQQDRFDEGIRILERVRGATQDSSTRDQIDVQMREIEARQQEILRIDELNRQIGLYNEAVDRANRRDFNHAARILRKVIREATDPGLVSKAQELLRKIDSLGH